MTPFPTGSFDPLDGIIAEYLQALENGNAPTRESVLARHLEQAERLSAFFRDFDAVGQDASKFRLPLSSRTADTITHDKASAMQLPKIQYLGDYELQSEIARGGMGVVYRAKQVSLNRPVAVKMILAGTYATPEAVQRFRAEAEAAANLDHPNILPIYEVGEHEGHQYFSMKLVEGGSLSSKIDELKSKPKQIAELIATLARAVHFAHQRGILHRDLKPANVLIDADGTPYVTDFGLAKKVDADDGSTRTGSIVGTPSYMAPEQARGEKGLTTSVDVYSLGAILYEMLTGQPPFKGATIFETVKQVMEMEARDPRSINPSADRDLCVIALKCISKDTSKRYSSSAEFADDLTRVQNGEAIAARPVGRLERSYKWVKRNPVIASMGFLVAFFAFGLTLALWMNYLGSQNALQRERELNTNLQNSEQSLTKQLQETEFNQYRQSIQAAQLAIIANQLDRAISILEEIAEPQREWEWHYLKRCCYPDIITLEGDKEVRNWISRDGSVLMREKSKQTIEAWSTTTFKRVAPVRSEPMRILAISGQGTHYLAQKSPTTIVLKALQPNAPGVEIPIPENPRKLVLARDASWVVWEAPVSEKKRLLEYETVLWDVSKRKVLWRNTKLGPMNHCVSSPDDRYLAFTRSTPFLINVLDRESGKQISTLNAFFGLNLTQMGTAVNPGVAFRPERDEVFAIIDPMPNLESAAHSEIAVFDLHSGNKKRSLPVVPSRVTDLSFSHDGESLALAGNDNCLYFCSPQNGQVLEIRPGLKGTYNQLQFTPDNQRVIVISLNTGVVQLWDALESRVTNEIRLNANLSLPFSNLPNPVFDRSGKKILYVQGKGIGAFQQLVDLELSTGQKSILERNDEVVKGFAIDREGEQLLILAAPLNTKQFRFMPEEETPTLELAQRSNGKRIKMIGSSLPHAKEVEMSPDGRYAATLASKQEFPAPPSDWEVTLWDLPKGEKVSSHAGWGGCVAFHPTKPRFATVDRISSEVVLYDIPSSRELLRWSVDPGVNFLTWDTTGSRLAGGKQLTSVDMVIEPLGGASVKDSSSRVTVWNGENGDKQFELPRARAPIVFLSPRRLATSFEQPDTFQIWDCDYGLPLLTVSGKQNGGIISLATSPDLHQLVTMTSMSQGTLLNTLRVHNTLPWTPRDQFER